jgi:hypothetical protein
MPKDERESVKRPQQRDILEMVAKGLGDEDDILNCADKLITNIINVLVDLRSKSEVSGHHADVVMERLDDIIDVLKKQQFRIVGLMIENTEFDT